VVESKTVPPIENVPAAVAAAVARPVNSPPLRELAKRGDRVCIVFTDVTRPAPTRCWCRRCWPSWKQPVCATRTLRCCAGIGMHRPSTHEEKVAKLGQAVVDRYRVIDSEPQNPAALVDLGKTETGIPLSVNKTAYEADLLIATGIVEPHQYAGYSGGRKTLAVGAAGEAMIAYTHGAQMVDHPAPGWAAPKATRSTRRSPKRRGGRACALSSTSSRMTGSGWCACTPASRRRRSVSW